MRLPSAFILRSRSFPPLPTALFLASFASHSTHQNKLPIGLARVGVPSAYTGPSDASVLLIRQVYTAHHSLVPSACWFSDHRKCQKSSPGTSGRRISSAIRWNTNRKSSYRSKRFVTGCRCRGFRRWRPPSAAAAHTSHVPDGIEHSPATR